MAQRTNNCAGTFYSSLPQQHRLYYKKYAQTTAKLSAQLTRNHFLRRCKKTGLNPSHIQNSFRCINSLLEDASPYRGKLQRAMDRFKCTILNIEIQDSYYKLKKLENEKAALTSRITQVSFAHIYTNFFQNQDNFLLKTVRLKRVTTDKKFERLLNTVEKSVNLGSNNEWIVNTTDVVIPQETLTLLGYGPKLALPFEHNLEIPYFKIIADLESILKLETDQVLQSATRCLFINILQNFVNKSKNCTTNFNANPVNRFLVDAFHKSKKFIRNNPDICIVAADKGNKTVIMKKDEYESKMQTLIDDTSTYERIKIDWTNKIQTKNNKLVNALYDRKLIDSQTRSRLVTHHAICPKIYGLPKIHKPGIPMRVILSCINCPTYELSKFLASILHQSIDHTKYNIKNSYEFHDFITDITLPQNYVLVSFDVVSLFTCIPRDLALKAVQDNWKLIEQNTTIKDRDAFSELVDFTLNSSYFVFRGGYYRQKEGTAMGNPLSPALADLVMETLLDQAMQLIDIPVPFMKKYVDDLITALPVNMIERVNETLNSLNSHIQFTREVEIDSKLPYLDMLLVRTEGQRVLTDWYKKPTASGRILNFNSLHPLTHKLNTATGFIGRVFKLSTYREEREKRDIVRKYLLANNYPSSIINRLINRFSKKNLLTGRDSNLVQAPKNNVFRSLHYVPNLSTALARVVNRNYNTITISFKCAKTTKSLFTQLKDITHPLCKRNLIYRIPCMNCTSSYIGLTTQQLKQRLAGHRSLIKRYEEFIASNSDVNGIDEFKKTALMVHLIEQNHTFDLSKTAILNQDDRLQALQILEMCHIYSDSTAINYRTDTNNLSVAYAGLLCSIAKR